MTALSGIRVIDLTRILAGPYCTMMLGDMGAEVIKIEQPVKGDDSREFGPFVNGISAYYLSINRNKKSVTINLKNEQGRKLFCELVKTADVVIENFRPGTMEKLGIGYESLKALNEKLIFASCSGFGQTGPYAKRPAYDLIVQGMGGMMSITGQPGGMPTKVGSSIGDIMAGMFTAIGILGALQARHISGLGQRIDVAMLDCQVAVLENAIARYLVNGVNPDLIGNRHPAITPFASFKTKDDYIIIAIGNHELWRKFCTIIQRTDLLDEPQYATNHLRTENYEELHQLLTVVFKEQTRDQWMAILEGEGIPCGPINNIGDVVADPHVIAREMIIEIDQPGVGKMKMPGSPLKFDQTPVVLEKAAPLLGEDTADVLSELLHFSVEEIEKLRVAGAIGA